MDATFTATSGFWAMNSVIEVRLFTCASARPVTSRSMAWVRLQSDSRAP
jgi:hypothetical protein